MERSEPNSPSGSAGCFPGSGDASNTVFLSLYEEEEAYERYQRSSNCTSACVPFPASRFQRARAREGRPSFFYILRLFDSIIGFHKGTLDLTGRHPERYWELHGLWSDLVCGFLGLENQGVVTRPSSEGRPTRKPYNTLDSERWRRFQVKHRLPECLTYANLLGHIQRVFREIANDAVPKFQRTCLLDLPAEVLDMIVDAVPLAGAKALASTCRRLSNIAQRQIFRTWRMSLHVPPHACTINIEYSSIDLPTLAHYAREDLRERARLVCASPHVSSRIQRLVLTDEWLVNRRAYPEQSNPFALSPAFYSSIIKHFASVCHAAGNLTTLVLSSIFLTSEICRMVADTPSLHTLELNLCSMDPVVEPQEASTFHSFPHIANLHLAMDANVPETYTQWFNLLFCPGLRTLSISESESESAVVTSVLASLELGADFWERLSLNFLERLSLVNISQAYLSSLIDFFTHHSDACTRLTHFKLRMDWGFSDTRASSLLHALSPAPLEVLVLEGLSEADLSLFDLINGLYGECLQALTLVRRHNASQRRNKLSTWPRPSWEYAQRFEGFKTLSHFCWNFRTEYWDATPSGLTAFESDFNRFDSDGQLSDYLAELPDDAPSYFLDTHYMALPFAAHCPSLETFCIMDSAVDMVCRVSRRLHCHHGVSLAPRYYNYDPTSSSCIAWDVSRWNTFEGRWPGLVPSAARRTQDLE